MLRFKHLFIFLAISMTLACTVAAEEEVSDQHPNVEQIREFIDTGRRYYRQRLYEKAIEAWQQALNLDPGNTKIEKYITRAQAKLGIAPPETENEAEETPQTETASTETAGTSQVDQLIDQGRNFYREGKYDQALAVWEQAAKLDPENKRLKRYMVKAQEKVSVETPPAETTAGETAPPAETPQQSAFDELVSQGKEHFRKNEFEQAVAVWKQALELDPSNEKIQKYIEKAEAKLTPEQPQETTAQPQETEIAEQSPAPPTPLDNETAVAEEVEIPAIIEEDNDIIRRDLEWCVNIAIENHREAQIAREKIKKAEIDLFIARRNFFPNLSFEYSTAQGGTGQDFLDNDTSTTDSTRDFVRSRYKFQLSHMVYTGGQARSEVEKAHISLEIEQKDYHRVVGQKALEVAKAYYEVARTEANLKVQGLLLKKAADSLKLVQEQFNAGLVAELELLNMKAQINQIHSQLAAAQQELSQAVLDLQQVMNIDITTPIRVYPLEETEISLDGRYGDIPLLQNIQTFSPTQQAVDDKNQMRMDSYVIHAMKNRPDFSAEQLKFKRAEKDLDIAKKAFTPKVEFFGELGEGAEDAIQRVRDLQELRREWLIGMNVSWNIWGNTVNYRQEERAEAPSVTSVGTESQRQYTVRAGVLDNLQPLSDQQEMVVKRLEALNDLGNLKNTITEEVRDAFHNFLKAKISKDTAKSKIDFRKKTVDLYKLQRSLGELDTSKLVQAEIDLANEQQELHRSLADFMIQLASLDSALGKTIFYAPREETQEIAEEEASPADNDTADNEGLAVQEPVAEEIIQVEYTGFLYKLDQITVGPSTHKIVDGFKNRRWVALARSDSINLNDYIGKKVRVSGQSLKTEDWIDTVIIDTIELAEKKWFWKK
ncbi:TolC family protein [bacterium]|nr:TolC family protein [bacterium]